MALIHDLRDELAAAGLGKPATLRVLAKFALLLAVAAGFLVLGLWIAPVWAKLLVAAVGSWFLVSATMCGHDGSHQAVSPKRWVNDLLAWTAFTLLGGLSNVYWRDKHNLKHHPFCNLSERDPDVTQWPFALSTEQHVASGWFWRHWHKVQAWFFYPITFFLLALLMRASGLKHTFGVLVHGPKRREAAIDLLFCALHYTAWLVLPLALGASPSTVLWTYALTSWFAGLYLTAVFSPAHMTTRLVKESHDPLLLQLATTRNFTTGWFFGFTLIGLDHQIEHHLAAKLSHLDLPRAKVIVKAFCARHGLPYQETSWWRALRDTHVRLTSAWDMPEIVIGDPPLAPPPRLPAERSRAEVVAVA